MSVQFHASLVHVCRYLDHRDIANLLKVSSTIHIPVGVAIAQRINRLLRKWITPLTLFWTSLDACGGIIAGSFVIRLLDNSGDPWPPGSLDIYLSEQGGHVNRMIAFFSHFTPFHGWMTTDFDHVPRPLARTYPAWGEELAVAGYDESTSEDGRKVRIFRVRTMEPLDAIPFTFSTTHVNFLTSNVLVCAYPRATLNQRGFVPPEQWKHMDHWILSSFAGRGYRIRDFVKHLSSDGEVRDSEFHYNPHVTRSLGDSECLRFPVERGALGAVPFPIPIYPTIDVANSISWRYVRDVRHDCQTPILESRC